MRLFESITVHFNEERQNLSLTQNMRSSLPVEPVFKLNWEIQDKMKDIHRLTQLGSFQFLLKGSVKDYLLQVAPKAIQKQLLSAASRLLEQYSTSHSLFVYHARLLEMTKARIDSQHLNSQNQTLTLRKMSYSNLSGKFLIFVSWVSCTPECYDLLFWSPSGEILQIFTAIPKDSVSQEVLGEFENIRQCFCIFLNTHIGLEAILAYMDALKAGQNDIIIENQHKNANMDYYCNQIMSGKTPKNNEIWFRFQPGFKYILSSQASLGYLLYGEFHQRRKQIMEMISGYCEKVKELVNVVNGQNFQEVLALCNNLCQISRANGIQLNMCGALEQLIESIIGNGATSAYQENLKLYLDISYKHTQIKRSHCLKCRVCKKNNKSRGKKDGKCKKSKYVCKQCSQYFDQQIHLCVTCCEKFHDKIKYYMEMESNRNNRRGQRAPASPQIKQTIETELAQGLIIKNDFKEVLILELRDLTVGSSESPNF